MWDILVSKNDSIGKNKSMTLEDLKDLLMLPDITFVDLQYTDTSEESTIQARYGIEVLKLEEIDNFNDIDGLASLIDACDCVVSVSNTTVHIAGAIGKETYFTREGKIMVLVKRSEQSIWYKSIKIIEQTKIGQWIMLFNKLKIIFYYKIVNKNTLLENDISLLINLFNKGFYSEVIEKGKE